MRGIAALGVLAFHVVVVTRFGPLDSLYLLVDFFFVLSGFVLFPSMPKQLSKLPRDGAKFVMQRIVRLWPVLIAVLGLIYVIYALEQDKAGASPDPNFSDELFIQSFLLLQIWFSATIAMNWPLWSLSAEWFANLVFAPLATLKTVGIVAGVVLGYVALWYGLENDFLYIGNSRNRGSGPIREWEALGRAMIGFGLGLLIRMKFEWLKRFRNIWLLMGSLVLAWLLFSSHTYFQGTMVYWTTYFAGPVFALVVLQASQFNPHPKKFFGRILTFLGQMSFGIYAFHVVVSLNYDKHVPAPTSWQLATNPEWSEYLVTKIFVVSFISIVLAFITFWLVEKPLQHFGRKLINKTFAK
jgi:peptidoglycan/LPS O-acetylase OafA/YrhL